ncbi:AEC family transporter [Aestuariispira insulae]|uniref:Malonate transporter n=1 Tax=Aestuariispira insulae TaxID=1461337 RepID=A0A3D9HXW8_9PROT|nr:AEC family transporter [Aestuariispira insulae]RED54348.1 hypothetical protein DFP90_1011151 [Aestuariispira insulae]
MHALLNVAIPVFAIMLTGFLCGRFRILGQDSTAALNGFVYYVALPALFFISMARAPMDDIFNWPYLAVVFGGQLATFGIALIIATFVFPGRLSQLSQHGMCAVFSNTGYMGIPLLMTAFGEDGALPAITATILNGAVVMPLGMAIMEMERVEAGRVLIGIRDVFTSVAKSPLVMSAFAGLLVSALGLPLPSAIETFCDLLGAAAGPSALFAIGLFLITGAARSNKLEIAWVSALKLLLMPLITWWLATFLFELSPLDTAAAVILAALPTGGLVFLLSQQYQVYLKRSAAIILITTVGSLLTVSAILANYVPG